MSTKNAGIAENKAGGIWTLPNGAVYAWGRAALDHRPYVAARDKAVADVARAKAKLPSSVGLSAGYTPPPAIKPSTDPALQTVGLLEASKALSVDSIKLMQMIAAGDVRTATVGDDEMISRREIDRVIAAREGRDREAKALLNPDRPDHVLDLVAGAGSGTEADSAELAELIGGDVDGARGAARRRARS